MLSVKETIAGCAAPRRSIRTTRRGGTPWRAAGLVALAATLSLASALPAQRAELERRIKREVLPNGLEVIAVENRGVPLVTIEADVKNGSFTQSPDYSGLSHLYEHMFFKANQEYPRPDEFVGRASELGAVFNGSTSEERVNYYLTVPADSAAGGMQFLADALISPLFREDELNREREVVIGEYDRNESSPDFAFNTAMGKALWTTAWSRKNPLGDRAVIKSTTPEKMRTIQHRYYIPNNTALIVTGDIAPAQVFSMAEHMFGAWQRGPDPFTVSPVPPIPPLVHDTAVIVEQPIGDAVEIMLQWQGPSASRDPASTYAADVFSDVLNQPSSQFQKHLVDSGLFQGIGVNYYTLNHVGPITISGITSPDKTIAALAALRRELRHVNDPGYLSPDALQSIKQGRIIGTMRSLERASGFAQQLGFWWAVTGLDYFYGYVDTMARQTPRDLLRYANRYIVGQPSVTGVLISPDARASLHLTTEQLLSAGARQ
jgi:zinc protease